MDCLYPGQFTVDQAIMAAALCIFTPIPLLQAGIKEKFLIRGTYDIQKRKHIKAASQAASAARSPADTHQSCLLQLL